MSSGQIYRWKCVGVFLDSVRRRNPIWEFCCLLKALELRSLTCPLRRPLIELHCDQQWGPCMYYSGGRTPPWSSGTVLSRIRWVIEFRKSAYCVRLASPRVHLTRVLIGSQGLCRFHGEASQRWAVGVILSTLRLGRRTPQSNGSKALHLAEIFFFP